MSIPAKTCLLGLVTALSVAAAPPPHYVAGRQIAGPDGGWDYARLDPETRHLYVAHGNAVTEVDVAHGDGVRSYGAIEKAHAVVPLPGRLLLVTSGHDDSVRLLDTGDGHEVAKIAVGSDPDAAFYDPASGQAAIINAKAGTISVIDVASRQVVRTIVSKPGLEFGVLGKGDEIFVNNEDENEIETADLQTGKTGPAIALPGCTGPTGLGYDTAKGFLVSACANGKAIVVDGASRQVVAALDIGQGPDAVIMDEAKRYAYIPCGRSGTLSIIALEGAHGPTVVGTAKTELGARTGALDPADGTIYLPTARFTPPAAAGGKPVMVAGSFHILAMEAR